MQRRRSSELVAPNAVPLACGWQKPLLLMALCGSLAFLSGCGARAVAKPAEDAVVTKQTEEGKRKRGPKPVVAPPPAYGNKVVLEQSGSSGGVAGS